MRRYRKTWLVGLAFATLTAATGQIKAQEESKDDDHGRFGDNMGYLTNHFEVYLGKCRAAERDHQQSMLEVVKQESEDNIAWRTYLDRPKKLTKVVIHIERSTNRFHTVSLLGGSQQGPLTIEVANEYVRHRLVPELKEMPRVFYNAPVASKLGSIRLFFDDLPSDEGENVLEIGISDSAFIMGNGIAGFPKTSFYSWTLANFLAESLQGENAALTQLSFNILSGADALGCPAKYKARFASNKLREYWSGPADPWYSFPSELRSAASPNKIFPYPKNDYDFQVHVVPLRFSVGDFEWFRVSVAKPFQNTDLEFVLTARNGDVGGPRLSRLLQTRVTTAGPIDVSECTIMGVISFFAEPNDRYTNPVSIDVFVTNKGFLWQQEKQYRVFHSHDLATWLNNYLETHNYDMSQKAVNVLSGADLIVFTRAEHFAIFMREYDLRSAWVWHDIPERFTSAFQSK